MFSSSGRHASWTAKLLDAQGRPRAGEVTVAPRRSENREGDLRHDALLLGALSRTLDGMPVFPPLRSNRQELAPTVARLNAAYFPDDPIALEGLSALYFNTSFAPGLTPPQAKALLEWTRAGGHLIVAVDQPGDVAAVPWLKKNLPADFGAVISSPMGGEFQRWILNMTNLPPAPAVTPKASGKSKTPTKKITPTYGSGIRLTVDSAFENSALPLVEATPRGGSVVLQLQDKPLLIEAAHGLGKISVLAFNPEREPFRSWENRPWFWARLCGVPPTLIHATSPANYGGQSLDAIFGALIDSRQVRKLPVSALVLLLAVYLAVIGPVDFIWLRRVNRTVLTWITFPLYVLLFSALIYFIGFALRAGKTEWNELHVVDVFPSGERAELRGRTFASIYSPSSTKYPVAADPACAHSAWRAEFMGSSRGRESGARMDIVQRGINFQAQLYVPVWVNQLAACDWWRTAPTPLALEVTQRGDTLDVKINHASGNPLQNVRFVARGRVHELGTISATSPRQFTLKTAAGIELTNFVNLAGANFQNVVQFRGQAFGDANRARLDNDSTSAMAASFISLLNPRSDRPYSDQLFIAPAGFDLTPVVKRGDAVLLAWDAGHSFINPLNQFPAKLGARNTLLRLAAPIKQEAVNTTE
ncbi:MAG: hypothetical protein HZA89_14610, partial [Verrucomicrobia bacterium]|nr:hypothetical protein [Verrucomicrobiota bacterium]